MAEVEKTIASYHDKVSGALFLGTVLVGKGDHIDINHLQQNFDFSGIHFGVSCANGCHKPWRRGKFWGQKCLERSLDFNPQSHMAASVQWKW